MVPGSRRRSAAQVFLVMAMVALAGCALRQPGPAVDWAQRRERLLALADWQARGRIAVKADGSGGQGDLDWEQHGEAARIRVSGPFGAGAYEIRWDPQTLSVRSRNGEFSRDYAGSGAAEQFLAEQLGWSFPAASSRYWLLGLSDPALPAREVFAADGQLASLEQNGWTVIYDRYEVQADLPMPARMTLQNSRARVRLVIDRWIF